jgi:hypothetical protein
MPETPPTADIRIETAHLEALISTRGYVSGIRAGSFRDRLTGARDLGFGLSVVDFLLEPADPAAPVPPGQYEFGAALPVHGNIPKRYVEGPQICTRAGRLPARVSVGPDFVAVRLRYRWHQPYAPRTTAGSLWEQTLIFPQGARYFLSADRVTTANSSDALFFRVDLPGHIKHRGGMEFDHVYLSYHDPAILPSSEFRSDFPPDARFLYRRDDAHLPERFIRAYQVNLPDGREGPWLAGMTLNPADVYQAWCHQRGYVCMIQENGGGKVKPGDTFGACYVIGWFDDLDAMEAVYDRHKGWSGLVLEGPEDALTGWRGLRADELTPIGG